MPSHSEIASSLRRNGPGSKYPRFEEKLENCGINERTLDMSILIDYHIIIIRLQIYEMQDLLDPCAGTFECYFHNRMLSD